jgi:hypothetical protein
MGMGVRHAHIRESAESISIFFVYFSFGMFFPFVCVPILALLQPDRRVSRYIHVLQNLCSLRRITLASFNRRLEQKHLCIVLPIVRLHLSSRGAI